MTLTKPDKLLKTDQELLELISYRLSLPTQETGISDLGIIESAIGALFLGQRFGLKILRIIHASSTLKKYETFYGVPLDDLLPQHGQFIDRSYAWRVVKTTREYWDVVARKFSIDNKLRRSVIDSATDLQ